MGSYTPEPPTIELDRTLYDLYSEDNEGGTIPDLAYVVPSVKSQLCSAIPFPKKYAFQAPLAPNMPPDIMARVCLSTGPQYMAFVAGKMRVNLFDPDQYKNEDARDEDDYRPHQRDALQVYAQIPEHQRPDIKFVSEIADIEISEKTKLATCTPLDGLDGLPQLVDPETHYELLSKRELAKSGLPTPKSEVIDCTISLEDTEDEAAVDAEVDRMMQHVLDAEPPTVIKLPQALAAQGVFVIHDEEEKEAAVEKLGPAVKLMIEQISESNNHLHPASLIIQELLPDTSVAISCFVTKAGRVIFTSCCEQNFDPTGGLAGASINYFKQNKFKEEYVDIMEKAAKHVYDRGYWGPMGIDVMEDDDGNQLIVDLNVRVTSSYLLGFLKNHLSIRLGYNHATMMYPLPLKGTREEFDTAFQEELASGQLTIAGWCQGRAGPWGIIRYSVACIVVAGENREAVAELSDRLNEKRIRK